MTKVPVLKPKDVIKAFENFGWKVVRSKGSHIIMIKEGSISTLSIPKHKEIARGTLRKLIKSSGISLGDFVKALK